MTAARGSALAGVLLTAAWLVPAAAVRAQEAAAEGAYSRNGADTCIKCHDDAQVLSLFKTPHGSRGDPHSPFAGGQLQCEACHGPGGAHSGRVRTGEPRPAILNFGKGSGASAPRQDEACLGCHGDAVGGDWHSGPHEQAGVTCAGCHSVHAPQDAVRSVKLQSTVCFDCHQRQRAEYAKPFHHPVEGNLMGCTSCHGPHGSSNEYSLRRATANETCYTCHAEKRGPFLWEHAPVAEDCSNCHVPHASTQPALLTLRAPLLCQQCHSQAGHPSFAYGPEGLPGTGQPSSYLLAGSCLNCHAQVHGSNHPSGSRLTR